MPPQLATVPNLQPGRIRDRLNRFVLEVELPDAGPTEVYFSNTGGHNLIEPGRAVLVQPVADADRRTAYDARFVAVDGTWVSATATFANDVFRAAVEDGHLPTFANWEVTRAEPPLPEGGRADFTLERDDGAEATIEVKSCSLVEDGVAKFPDRPTERGRRHVETLADLNNAHVVLVVQRADADRFEPNRAVDPAFADALQAAREAGVGVHAMQIKNEPPAVSLANGALPLSLS